MDYKLWRSELDGPGVTPNTGNFFKKMVEGVPKPTILVFVSLILKYMGGFMQKNGGKIDCKYF